MYVLCMYSIQFDTHTDGDWARGALQEGTSVGDVNAFKWHLTSIGLMWLRIVLRMQDQE